MIPCMWNFQKTYHGSWKGWEQRLTANQPKGTFWKAGKLLQLDCDDNCLTPPIYEDHGNMYVQWSRALVCKLYLNKMAF